MDVLSILKAEAAKPASVALLFDEGLFCKAYEHSAFLICKTIHSFKVSSRFVQKAGQYVVSIGFPKSSLAKWTSGCSVAKNASGVEIKLPRGCEGLVQCDFEQWKAELCMSPVAQMDQPKQRDCVASEPVCYAPSPSERVMDKLRNFPLEQKSPIDCMLLVAELKKIVNEEKG